MKALLKTIMIGIICGNLLLVDINFKLGTFGINQALATNEAGITKSESDIKDDNLLSTLAMIAIGTVTSRLISCKPTPDMYAAAAGGALFIAGEAMAFLALKKNLKGYEEFIKNDLSPEELNHQIAIFEKIRKGYEKAIETANTKIGLQTAAAAAFAGAAILAGSFYAAVSTALATCNTALSTAATACYASFTASCVPPSTCYQPFLKSAVGFSKSIPTRIAAFAGYSVPAVSTSASTKDVSTEAKAAAEDSTNAGMCPGGAGVPAACAGYATAKANFGGVCPAAGLAAEAKKIDINNSIENNLQNLRSLNPTFFTASMLKLISSKAEAFSFLGVAASSAVKYIIATSKTVALKIDMFLYNPKNRAILWGILAAMTYAATTSTKNVVKQLEARMAVIDQIIADLKSRGLGQETDDKTGKLQELAAGTPQENNQGKIETVKTGNDSTVGNQKTAQDVKLDEALPCATKMVNGSCESFEKHLVSSDGFNGLEPATKNELLAMAKMTDGVSGKSEISGATLEGIGKMGDNANALNSKMAKSFQEIDKLSKLNNEPDVGTLRDGLKNDFLNAVKSEVQKSGQNTSDFYASLSGLENAKIDIASDTTGSAESGNKALGMSAEDQALIDQLNALSAQAPSLPAQSKSGVDVATVDLKSGPVAKEKEESKDGVDLSEYDINDINSDKTKNIFDVITNRYQRSGFSRLFPKQKAEVKLEENMKGE